jgi:hypothetical protein
VYYQVVSDLYPQLIVTPHVPSVLQNMLDRGCMSIPLTECQDIVAYRGDRVVVIADLARHPGSVRLLLKVLEAATCKIVCLSSRDEYDATFLSRFAVVEKYATVYKNEAPAALDVNSYVLDDNRDLSLLVKTGPAYLKLVLLYLASRLPSKRKIFQ